MEYYTYVWHDATGTPFYVGKGKGKRAYDTAQRSKEFKEIYALGGCAVEIVDRFIHESQAHAHEVELIGLYGRRDQGGILINKTDGGEGIVGLRHTTESRARISAAHQGKKHSLERVAKMASSHRGKTRTVEARARMSAAQRANTVLQETRAKMARSLRSAPPASGFKGVRLNKKSNRWVARISINGVRTHIGSYSTPEEAAIAYDAAAYAAFGNDCYLNFKDRVAANGNLELAGAA